MYRPPVRGVTDRAIATAVDFSLEMGKGNWVVGFDYGLAWKNVPRHADFSMVSHILRYPTLPYHFKAREILRKAVLTLATRVGLGKARAGNPAERRSR